MFRNLKAEARSTKKKQSFDLFFFRNLKDEAHSTKKKQSCDLFTQYRKEAKWRCVRVS